MHGAVVQSPPVRKAQFRALCGQANTKRRASLCDLWLQLAHLIKSVGIGAIVELGLHHGQILRGHSLAQDAHGALPLWSRGSRSGVESSEEDPAVLGSAVRACSVAPLHQVQDGLRQARLKGVRAVSVCAAGLCLKFAASEVLSCAAFSAQSLDRAILARHSYITPSEATSNVPGSRNRAGRVSRR